MQSLSPVVWSEGMHLAQNHFQAQSRYFEALAAFGIQSLFFRPYGLLACELDTDALLNGTVVLTHARGVMPDGLTFHFPDDPPPAPLEIDDTLSPTREGHIVRLAIPALRPGHANCQLEDGATTEAVRYRAGIRNIPDETTGHDEKPVSIALKNFRLILDEDPAQELVTLPLARVKRDGSGHFIYDPEYIPPSLRIGASPRLMTIVERLAGIMDTKAEALQTERREARTTPRHYQSDEIAGFWLSHTIHTGLTPLRHHLQMASAHPEALYSDLSRLAGALCTFTLHAHPRDLPLYDHEDLDRCFNALDQQIRGHLELVVPKNHLSFPLTPGEGNIHTLAITEPRAFKRARWLLALRSGTGALDAVAAQVPRLVKTCSALHIARLVRDAYPGLTMEHLPVPPAGVPPRGNTHYFSLAQTGPCWKSIVDTREVGVYLPDAIPAEEVELVILPEA
jgi:type VI secretion system protein ImpJ